GRVGYCHQEWIRRGEHTLRESFVRRNIGAPAEDSKGTLSIHNYGWLRIRPTSVLKPPRMLFLIAVSAEDLRSLLPFSLFSSFLPRFYQVHFFDSIDRSITSNPDTQRVGLTINESLLRLA